MAGNLDQIVEQLSTLSVLEAAELVKKLEEKWGSRIVAMSFCEPRSWTRVLSS